METSTSPGDKDGMMLDRKEYARQVKDLRKHLINAVAAATIGVPEKLNFKSEFARLGGSLAQNEILQAVAMHMTNAADAFDRIQRELGIFPAQRTWFGGFLESVQFKELMEEYRASAETEEKAGSAEANEAAEASANATTTKTKKSRQRRSGAADQLPSRAAE